MLNKYTDNSIYNTIIKPWQNLKGNEEALESIITSEKSLSSTDLYKIYQIKLKKSDGWTFINDVKTGINECKRNVYNTINNRLKILTQVFGYLANDYKYAKDVPKNFVVEIVTDKYVSYLRFTETVRSVFAKFLKLYKKYYNGKRYSVSPSKIWSKECLDVKDFMKGQTDLCFKTFTLHEISYKDFLYKAYKIA